MAHVGWPTVLYVFQGAMPDILAMLSQILMTEQEQPEHRNHDSRAEFCRVSFPWFLSLPDGLEDPEDTVHISHSVSLNSSVKVRFTSHKIYELKYIV